MAMQVPFWAPTEAGIFKQVLQGQLDLHAGPCKGLSQDAKHLMLSLLTRDTKVWHVASCRYVMCACCMSHSQCFEPVWEHLCTMSRC